MVRLVIWDAIEPIMTSFNDLKTCICNIGWYSNSNSSSKFYFQQNTTMEQYQEKENTL